MPPQTTTTKQQSHTILPKKKQMKEYSKMWFALQFMLKFIVFIHSFR